MRGVFGVKLRVYIRKASVVVTVLEEIEQLLEVEFVPFGELAALESRFGQCSLLLLKL